MLKACPKGQAFFYPVGIFIDTSYEKYACCQMLPE
jgi:hypothetical protein